ncbi:MFS transporter [Kitasatospora sp. MMS16-BH015]|uniref:MFS transporter n=1 Tax=Kitasatospora sp. MMS16-BH015 TaxID=2018025 RepID=UPI000CA12B73|nr:MFS transporter [Kitasatospora sp. MMS16-BH015]AUG78190.1 MFS transporter [Kitasatospora sp. MMS16-BH015]
MRAGLLALGLGTFAVGTDSFVLVGMLPQVAGSLHVSVPAGGQVIIAYALAHALLSPAVVAALRWPSRPVLLTGLGLLVLGNLLTGLAPGFGAVVACRILAALGGALFLPICTVTAVSTAPPPLRGRALTVVRGGSAAAAALGIPLGVVLARLADWRLAMYFVAGVGLLATLAIARYTPGIPATAPIHPARGLAPLADPRIGRSLLMTTLLFCGLFTPYSYASGLFHRGAPLALVLACWGAGALAGLLTSARLTDVLGSRRLIHLAALLSLTALALTPWSADRLPLALATALAWGFAATVPLIPIQHRLIAYNPAAAPFSILLTSTATYLGLALSATTGALLLTFASTHYLGPTAAALILLALALDHPLRASPA